MAAKIYSCSFTGLNCHVIEVQADISNGLSSFSIVGMGDLSVQESKERIRSSIKNCGFTFPQTKKTINLAPAQIRKQGSLFDLPIAVSLLVASKQLNSELLNETIIVGELSLNGSVRPVNGILLVTQFVKEQGFKRIILPKDNALEASFIKNIEIVPVENLKNLVEFCLDRSTITPFNHHSLNQNKFDKQEEKAHLFNQIIGHEKAKRALAIAACGHHNILFRSSPGCGKTVLARAFRDLLTEMKDEEVLETTKIYSIAGLLEKENPLITNRPFREVHHTASLVSVVGGGGLNPKPGEISLAHNGVLFLDEIAEFPRQVLEALRQPLEDKFIHITRANFSAKFPCNFILIATMNPCQCGYKNDNRIKCICSEAQLKNYCKRLSGPILDRFDIFLDINKIPISNFLAKGLNQKSDLEQRLLLSIKTAKQAQDIRFCEHRNILRNSEMAFPEIKKYCDLDKNSEDILKQSVEKLNLSTRGYFRTIKIARTIADMEAQEKIQASHIAEAIQYREHI